MEVARSEIVSFRARGANPGVCLGGQVTGGIEPRILVEPRIEQQHNHP